MRAIRILLLLSATLALALPLGLFAAEDASRKDLLYTCACGQECNCGSVSTRPGKCACGKEMRETHLLKVEGDVAIVCTCGGGCLCSLDPKDPTKCGCGKEVDRVNLKGTGIYFCNCGGSCRCNTVSDAPGDCRCGMKLIGVD